MRKKVCTFSIHNVFHVHIFPFCCLYSSIEYMPKIIRQVYGPNYKTVQDINPIKVTNVGV